MRKNKENTKCDLCGKEIKLEEKIRMTNKINGNVIDICNECYRENWEGIDERVFSLEVRDEMGTHALDYRDYVVKCKKCGKERALYESDIKGDDIEPLKCECGGENQFRYWLDRIYTEEEYKELERKLNKIRVRKG